MTSLATAIIIRGGIAGDLLFGQGGKDARFERRNGGKGAGAPSNAALLNGKTAQDGGGFHRAVGIFQRIIRYQIAQFIAIHRKVGQAGPVVGDAIFDGVQEDDIGTAASAGQRGIEIDDSFLLIKQNHILFPRLAQRKRNAAEALLTCKRAKVTRGAQAIGQGLVVSGVGSGQRDRGEIGRNRRFHGSSRIGNGRLI